jgi:cytochrome oxidase Cu insertion factor (SCO1/SenC/PrrC family)
VNGEVEREENRMSQLFISAVRSVALLSVFLLSLSSATAAETKQQPGTAGQDGHDPHAHHRAMLAKPQTSQGKSTQVELLDRQLVTQAGDKVMFASEVIADRIVVMDFVYTSCTTVCPVLSAVFAQLQDRLGERLGDEVILVSVSVDPTRDTPPRLRAYAARHKAREGWVWLTGDKRTVDQVLQDLGAYTPNFEDHPSMVLVGDGGSGSWTRYFGFPGTDQIMARVDELVAARQTAAAQE